MSRCLPQVVFLILLFPLTGCNTDFGKPYLEEGPLPLSGPDLELTRYQQTRRHPKIGKIHRTLWSDGGSPAEPMHFIEPLKRAIPESIHEKLQETEPAIGKNGRPFDRPKFWAHATVVSLKPDVLIVTIRPSIDQEDFEHPFADFSSIYCDSSRRKRLEARTELIDCNNNPLLCFYAGTLLPYSEEMYLFSTHPDLEDRELVFDTNPLIVETEQFSLRLVKSGTDVLVMPH